MQDPITATGLETKSEAFEPYPGFCGMKQLGVFLIPLDGRLVKHRSFPQNLLGFQNSLPVHVPMYILGWRDAT